MEVRSKMGVRRRDTMISIGIIAIVIFSIYYFQPYSYPWLGKEVTKKWMLPPELLGGKVIHIGDSYEEVVRKIPLKAVSAPPVMGSSGVIEGNYEPVGILEDGVFAAYYFNESNILVSIGVNTKSFRLKEQDSIARYLIKRFSTYYGDYTIYDEDSVAWYKVVEWSRPDSGYIALSYYPYILNVRDSSYRKDIAIRVNYYPYLPRPSLSYPVSKNSRQELGLE